MATWIAKAAAQKFLSVIPFGKYFHHYLQSRQKSLALTDDFFLLKLSQLEDHLSGFQKFYGKSLPKSCLELGTGWHPVIPLLLFVKGCEEIITIDIHKLVNVKRLRETIACLLRNAHKIPSAQKENIDALRILQGQVTDVHNALQQLKIGYIINHPENISVGRGNFHLVISNNTLQHIRAGRLYPIIKNLNQHLSPGGIHSHFIDMIDQFHHYDRSLNRYHFLKYSANEWKWIDNSIVHQNRLRLDDYRALFAQTGNEILAEKNEGLFPEEFSRLKLHSNFKRKDAESCMVTHSTIVARQR